MKLVTCLIVMMMAAGQLPPKAGTVNSLKEAKADFTKFTTYSWERGQETFDQKAHKLVVAAIDEQMAAHGFKPAPAGKADVTIRYFNVVRTDVDLDKIDEATRDGKQPPTQNMGRLAIVMRDATNRRVWAADTVQPLSADRAKVYDEIRPIVGKLFETYPGKPTKK